jgi:hypothetical protein
MVDSDRFVARCVKCGRYRKIGGDCCIPNQTVNKILYDLHEAYSMLNEIYVVREKYHDILKSQLQFYKPNDGRENNDG